MLLAVSHARRGVCLGKGVGGGGALFLQQCTMQCKMHMHDAMHDAHARWDARCTCTFTILCTYTFTMHMHYAVHDAVHGATGAPEEERPRLGRCLRERVRLCARRRLALRRCRAGEG